MPLPQDLKILSAIKEARRAVKKQMFSYIAAGLGLVAGLAWNDAIKTLIERLVPNTGDTVIAKLIYAVLITAIVCLALFYIEKSINREEKKD